MSKEIITNKSNQLSEEQLYLIEKELKEFRTNFNPVEFTQTYTPLFTTAIKAELNGILMEDNTAIQDVLNYHFIVSHFLKTIFNLSKTV